MSVKIQRKAKIKIAVPTASMPDIIFQLLIFFMVTTVLRQYDGLEVELPDAKKIEKLPNKRDVSTIWINGKNQIVLDDVTVSEVNEVRTVVYNKLVENKRLIMSLKVDKGAEMGTLIDVQQELRKANALKVNYSALQVL